MTTTVLRYALSFALLAAILSAAILSSVPLAANASEAGLAQEVAKLAFPKSNLLAMIEQQVDEKNREVHRQAMRDYFDYNRVLQALAGKYAEVFTEAELGKILAYHKQPGTQAALNAVLNLEGRSKPEAVPTSPPEDTRETRGELAMELATLVTEKDLVLGAIREVLADKPESERQAVLGRVAKLYDDAGQLHMMRLTKARDFIDALTTKQLRGVVDFLSAPAGQKLLRNNAKLGRTAVEATMKEALRASEKQRDASIRELQDTIRRSR